MHIISSARHGLSTVLQGQLGASTIIELLERQ